MQCKTGRRECRRGVDDVGDTAFTRIPFCALSFARGVVAASRLPWVIAASSAGMLGGGVSGPGGTHGDHATAVSLIEELGDDSLGEVKEAGHLVAGGEDVVLGLCTVKGLGMNTPRSHGNRTRF